MNPVPAPDDLSPTATVILGFLSQREMSGYEIKAETDVSTRFFWSASYGQIYPELKRLRKRGLIEGADRSQGGRKRTVYRLTGTGRRILTEWLRRPPDIFELRHDGILKVYFAGALPADERVAMLRGMLDQHRAQAVELGEARERVAAEGSHDEDPWYDLVLRFGLDFNDWAIAWCERELLVAEAEDPRAAGDA